MPTISRDAALLTWRKLQLSGYSSVPLKPYVFCKNPISDVGLFITILMEEATKVIFMLYGKKVRIVSKKIAAAAKRRVAGM